MLKEEAAVLEGRGLDAQQRVQRPTQAPCSRHTFVIANSKFALPLLLACERRGAQEGP